MDNWIHAQFSAGTFMIVIICTVYFIYIHIYTNSIVVDAHKSKVRFVFHVITICYMQCMHRKSVYVQNYWVNVWFIPLTSSARIAKLSLRE